MADHHAKHSEVEIECNSNDSNLNAAHLPLRDLGYGDCRDMPVIGSVKHVHKCILACGEDGNEFEKILATQFAPPGSDLASCTPPDWSQLCISTLRMISCPSSRKLAININAIWPHLTRKVLTDASKYLHSVVVSMRDASIGVP